jgi:translation initiation factor IF-2
MLNIGKVLFAHGRDAGKVRAIINTEGNNVREAFPGDAVEVLGMTQILPSGSVIFDREVEPAVAPEREIIKQTPADIMKFLTTDNPDFIPIILKTETSAEIEAIKNALPPNIKVIFEGQGEIGVSDILMAKDFHALVLGFNVDVAKDAKFLADSEKIFYKSYGIIYQMLDEINDLTAALSAQEGEKELGRGVIQASFLGSSGPILGLKITGGRLAVGDRIKIFRGEREMGTAEIVSIKQGKTDVKLSQKGSECGIMIRPEVDFAPQDAIIAYSKKQA